MLILARPVRMTPSQQMDVFYINPEKVVRGVYVKETDKHFVFLEDKSEWQVTREEFYKMVRRNPIKDMDDYASAIPSR